MVREQRQTLVRAAMPLALVVPRQHDEPEAAPPVRELAPAPACLDAKADLAALVLRQQEPLETALDVPFDRVVAEAEDARLLADAVHHGRAEVVEPEHLNLQQHPPPGQ